MSTSQLKPPANTRHIWRVADLRGDGTRKDFLVENEGREPFETSARLRNMRVIETLMETPIYAASPVRISDIIHILKRDVGLDIETKMYPGDPDGGSMSYGVYFLRSKVTLLDKDEVAA